MNQISFFGLGLSFNIDPIAFNIFNTPIYWYGIIVSIAFLTGYIVSMHVADKSEFSQDLLLDLILLSVPFAIIGARLYYVSFRLDMYQSNPWEIFNIRNGGLAIYGAIIASLMVGLIYCNVKRINIWTVLDIVSPGLIIGQAIGRWGNFVNQEAYGSETTLPWAMTINEFGVMKSVHPTFLYESLWNFAIFIVLIIFMKRARIQGDIFLIYIGLYSLGRFFIEGLRVDSLYFGIFRVSQMVALIFVVFSIIMFFKRRTNTPKNA